ncbi:trigger factor [Candidatus Saccharibacteria bacterium]|nr:trigger factor [Candidatus Saccharibacteria bacterium]
MKVEIREINKTEWEFVASFDAKDLEEAKAEVLKSMAPSVKIAGFRQGKAPMNLVESQVNQMRLIQDMADYLAKNKLLPEVESKTLAVIGGAEGLSMDKFVPNQEMTMKLKTDVVPNFKLPDWKKLKIKTTLVEPTAKEIDAEVEKILKSRANPKPADRAAKAGDMAVIDFVGKKDGEAFENGSAENYQLELGSNTFIEGFEDGVIGHKPGDEFELKLNFPKNYFDTKLAGAKVVFEVKLKKVLEMETPKLTDDIAKGFGAKSVEDFKDLIKNHLNQSKKEQAEKKLIDDFLMEMDKKAKIDLPEKLVKSNYEQFMNSTRENLERQGLTMEGVARMQGWSDKEAKERYETDALKTLRSQLILIQLANDLEIKPKDEEVQANYQYLLKQHEYSNKGRKQGQKKMPAKLDKKSKLWEDLARQSVLGRTYSMILNEYGGNDKKK